jgi:hypothetical protein
MPNWGPLHELAHQGQPVCPNPAELASSPTAAGASTVVLVRSCHIDTPRIEQGRERTLSMKPRQSTDVKKKHDKKSSKFGGWKDKMVGTNGGALRSWISKPSTLRKPGRLPLRQYSSPLVKAL